MRDARNRLALPGNHRVGGNLAGGFETRMCSLALQEPNFGVRRRLCRIGLVRLAETDRRQRQAKSQHARPAPAFAVLTKWD